MARSKASENKRLGILVAGGPAPGINSVIGAATICSRMYNTAVVGILDGFKWIMQGNIDHVTELDIRSVSRIHFRGGSYLGIARDNPTKDPKFLNNVVSSLLRLDINRLITIGGDDTLFSASQIEKLSNGRISVVHVPKTIDNDLDLPHGLSTFGFQTARHVGVNIVKDLMIDAMTTHRWYFVISMGRKAGHLALGIGKSAGTTLTIVPEEFKEKVSLNTIVDILVGAIIKRLSSGRSDGLAVIAEGLVEKMDPDEFKTLLNVERDEHDNIRLAEISFGEILKYEVQKRLAEYGLKVTVVAKNIGYELRCADPIPFDMTYTRDLGFLAAHFILHSGNASLITVQNGEFIPIPFHAMIDPATGKSKVRMVDVNSDFYRIAHAYMLRLKKADFEDPFTLAKLATVINISQDDFKKRFGYLIDYDVDLADIGQKILMHDADGPEKSSALGEMIGDGGGE